MKYTMDEKTERLFKNQKCIRASVLHKALWLWLSEDGNRFKFDWPGWQFIQIRGMCFACMASRVGGCAACPIKKDSAKYNPNGDEEDCLNGLYSLWAGDCDGNHDIETARIIADLKWEGVDPWIPVNP